MFRRYSIVARAALLLACAALPPAAAAQTATPTPTPTPTTTQEAPKKSEPAKPEKAPKKNELAAPTAEQVAETVILVHGVRERLAQVRRSGVERGRISRTTDDGRTEEITYERSFKRGENAEKDKIRLDQKRPNIEYALVYNEGRVFGVLRGTLILLAACDTCCCILVPVVTQTFLQPLFFFERAWSLCLLRQLGYDLLES